jgi:hypothetical protein
MRQSILLKILMVLVSVAAIGGAVVWGVAWSAEVRGETAAEEADARVEGMPETLADAVPEAGAVPSAQDLAGYLGGLRAEDYARYTHPRYGFSFTYPEEFILGTAVWGEEDVTDLWLARYRLGMRVTVRPIEGSEEILADLTSLPAAFDAEPPQGADGGAVAWVVQNEPSPGKHTYTMWFAHGDQLYHIQLHAPDVDVLEPWALGFVSSSFSFPAH